MSSKIGSKAKASTSTKSTSPPAAPMPTFATIAKPEEANKKKKATSEGAASSKGRSDLCEGETDPYASHAPGTSKAYRRDDTAVVELELASGSTTDIIPGGFNQQHVEDENGEYINDDVDGFGGLPTTNINGVEVAFKEPPKEPYRYVSPVKRVLVSHGCSNSASCIGADAESVLKSGDGGGNNKAPQNVTSSLRTSQSNNTRGSTSPLVVEDPQIKHHSFTNNKSHSSHSGDTKAVGTHHHHVQLPVTGTATTASKGPAGSVAPLTTLLDSKPLTKREKMAAEGGDNEHDGTEAGDKKKRLPFARPQVPRHGIVPCEDDDHELTTKTYTVTYCAKCGEEVAKEEVTVVYSSSSYVVAAGKGDSQNKSAASSPAKEAKASYNTNNVNTNNNNGKVTFTTSTSSNPYKEILAEVSKYKPLHEENGLGEDEDEEEVIDYEGEDFTAEWRHQKKEPSPSGDSNNKNGRRPSQRWVYDPLDAQNPANAAAEDDEGGRGRSQSKASTNKWAEEDEEAEKKKKKSKDREDWDGNFTGLMKELHDKEKAHKLALNKKAAIVAKKKLEEEEKEVKCLSLQEYRQKEIEDRTERKRRAASAGERQYKTHEYETLKRSSHRDNGSPAESEVEADVFSGRNNKHGSLPLADLWKTPHKQPPPLGRRRGSQGLTDSTGKKVASSSKHSSANRKRSNSAGAAVDSIRNLGSAVQTTTSGNTSGLNSARGTTKLVLNGVATREEAGGNDFVVGPTSARGGASGTATTRAGPRKNVPPTAASNNNGGEIVHGHISAAMYEAAGLGGVVTPDVAGTTHAQVPQFRTFEMPLNHHHNNNRRGNSSANHSYSRGASSYQRDGSYASGLNSARSSQQPHRVPLAANGGGTTTSSPKKIAPGAESVSPTSTARMMLLRSQNGTTSPSTAGDKHVAVDAEGRPLQRTASERRRNPVGVPALPLSTSNKTFSGTIGDSASKQAVAAAVSAGGTHRVEQSSGRLSARNSRAPHGRPSPRVNPRGGGAAFSHSNTATNMPTSARGRQDHLNAINANKSKKSSVAGGQQQHRYMQPIATTVVHKSANLGTYHIDPVLGEAFEAKKTQQIHHHLVQKKAAIEGRENARRWQNEADNKKLSGGGR